VLLLEGTPPSPTIRSAEKDGGRDGASPTSGSGYRPNTNLEQISHWLTKILVGVGLAEIAQAPSAASALGAALKPVLGDTPQSAGFGVACVLGAMIGGFFVTYLWTRLKLGAAFSSG